MAVAFSNNSSGFVALGRSSVANLKDVYEYSPATNTWAKKAEFPGAARAGSGYFTLGTKGYSVRATLMDVDLASSMQNSWSYNMTNDTWEIIPELQGIAANVWVPYSLGATLNGKGYIILSLGHLHVFDPASATWTKIEMNTAGANSTLGGTITSTGNSIFVGLGGLGSAFYELRL